MKTTPLVLACAMLAAALMPLAQAVEFDNNVRPLLELHCVKCHGANKQKGGLRLDTLGQAVKGGDSGTALAKGDPAKSLLLERISLAANHDDIMPP
ncbi:MAG: c-type cytochrome domain-containing protein, partial [Verrucomicrobiota bacterium]|nr:c-type cytochrome domain-containing protein [Verrucomicrobiota bacterium]